VLAQAHGLVARLSVPYQNALVRANVPVFGLAYGKDFKEYRVEYGEGSNPSEWKVTERVESNCPVQSCQGER